MRDVVRLGESDLPWMTELLVDAFADDPTIEYLFGTDEKKAAYFMRCTVAYTLLFGEAYGTAGREGVALWLPPGQTAMTPAKMYRAGMFAAPFRFGFSAFRRFLNFAGFTDQVHRKSVPMDHYYLFGMGVRRAAHGTGVGTRLMQSMLERLDRERIPAYLETQNEKNVPFYRRAGFEVVAQDAFPGAPAYRNWGMLRA